MISFRVKKGLDHAQIGLLKEFNSKFPTSIPTPFICRVPPLEQGSIYVYVFIIFNNSAWCCLVSGLSCRGALYAYFRMLELKIVVVVQVAASS